MLLSGERVGTGKPGQCGDDINDRYGVGQTRRRFIVCSSVVITIVIVTNYEGYNITLYVYLLMETVSDTLKTRMICNFKVTRFF